MKKSLTALLIVCFMSGVLAGCGSEKTDDISGTDAQTQSVTPPTTDVAQEPKDVEMNLIHPYELSDFVETIDLGNGKSYTKYYVFIEKSEDDFISQRDLEDIFIDVSKKSDQGPTCMVLFYYDKDAMERDKSVCKEYVYLVENTSGSNRTNNDPSSYIPPELVLQDKTPQPEESATPAKTELTTGEKNALSSAKQYLSIMSFSHSGLVDQLKYDGFTTEEATYAADNCGADWNEQAANHAKEYLDLMSFSKSSLIEQLVYDGFTQEQAEYGVAAAGY